MRTAHFDPFSGASGDMVLGALIDAGLEVGVLEAELAKLPLSGYHLTTEAVEVNAVRGIRLTVHSSENHHHRTWSDIRMMIETTTFSLAVKERSLVIFRTLAEAEAAAHGVPVDEVHFHEVGAVDSIVDICGAAIGFDALGIESATCGPVRVGAGFVRSQHGLMPVPAPATSHLLASGRVPVAPMPQNFPDVQAELLTPTGAAILVSICSFEPANIVSSRVAYGFGSMELPWPNALRMWLNDTAGAEEAEDSPERTDLIVLESNIDDMNPQAYELLMERAFTAGALDCWLTPIQMKKSRPAIILSILCEPSARARLEATVFDNSPTLGIRSTHVERLALSRLETTIATRFGEVRLKVAVRDDRISQARPEYEDCARLARETGRSFADVWDDAYRLGESLIGRNPDSLSET